MFVTRTLVSHVEVPLIWPSQPTMDHMAWLQSLFDSEDTSNVQVPIGIATELDVNAPSPIVTALPASSVSARLTLLNNTIAYQPNTAGAPGVRPPSFSFDSPNRHQMRRTVSEPNSIATMSTTSTSLPSKGTSDDEKAQRRKELARGYARKAREKKNHQFTSLHMALQALREENSQLRSAFDTIIRLAQPRE
jgi:hypothetical protein